MKIFFLSFCIFFLVIGCNKIIPIDSKSSSKITTRYVNQNQTDLICGNCNDLKSVTSPIKNIHVYDRRCRIPKGILLSPTLEELSIVSENLFFQVEPKLPSLKRLYIHDKTFSTIPDFILQHKSIEELLLFLEDSKSIEGKIRQMKQLQTLTLFFNHLDFFPSEILELENLKKLKIEVLDKSVIDIPEALYEMENLKTIEISSNSNS